jgi:hypothetical protein
MSEELLIPFAIMIHELDAKRAEIRDALAHPALADEERIRLEGMQAGLVWARILVQNVAKVTGLPFQEK